MYLNSHIIIELTARIRAPTDGKLLSTNEIKELIRGELRDGLGWENFDEEKEYLNLNINIIRNEITKQGET